MQTASIPPSLIDAILLGVALEFAASSVLLARRGVSRLVLPLLLYLFSGAALLAALRAALSDAAPHWIALALLASGAAHVGSMRELYRIVTPRRTA